MRYSFRLGTLRAKRAIIRHGVVGLILVAFLVSTMILLVDLSVRPTETEKFEFKKSKEVFQKQSTSKLPEEAQNVCVYETWEGRIPPLITYDDNKATRRRYDTLWRITATDPLPFTNVVIRSSFKAGFTYTSALVSALYDGNETRQLWLNQTRKTKPGHVSAVFLRDPIERFNSMYAQMLVFSNRKYHWYGDGDCDWLYMKEGPERVKKFVASVKRRFYNEHLLPQLWFLSESPNRAPNLTFVGRLERLAEDWGAFVSSFGVPDDVSRDALAFMSKLAKTDRARNVNRNDNAKVSIRRALYEEPDANTTLLDVCDIYRADFACFDLWVHPPRLCAEAWQIKSAGFINKA